MKRSVKALSAILILAALIGLAGGGLTLKDVMDCKGYWEAKGVESDANLAKLEDGLNTLKANEAAYLDGRDTYDQGLKEYEAGKQKLADGQKEYDAGVQTLKEKQAEYDAGVVKLASAKQQLADGQAAYDAGQASLARAGTLIAGLNNINASFTKWQNGYQGLLSFQKSAAANGTTLPDPAASNAAVYDAAIASTKADLEKGIAAYEKLAELNAQKAQITAAMSSGTLTKDELKELGIQLAQVQAGITLYTAGLYGKPDEATMRATLPKVVALEGAGTAVKDGQQNLSTGVATAINGIMGNEELAKKLLAASGMDAATLNATVAALPTMDYPTFDATMTKLTGLASSLLGGSDGLQAQYDAGQKKLAASKQQLDQGYADYAAGQAALDSGSVQLADGRARLEAAVKEIESGKQSLTDAEKQLADGKKQLAEFEDGRDQIIDGLETLKATETYAGLVSIADRLGADFSYMKKNGAHDDLDIEKGLAAVATGREFSADNGAAVTKELTTRGVAAVLALLGSLLALLAGIIGFTKRVKFSGVLSLIAVVASAGAAAAAVVAGSELSVVAGSAFSSVALVAGGILAVVALVHAIVALAPSKAAAV